MTLGMQDTLQRLWLGGQRGCLCGKEQARIWALRDCWTDEHDSEHGMYEHALGQRGSAASGEDG